MFSDLLILTSKPRRTRAFRLQNSRRVASEKALKRIHLPHLRPAPTAAPRRRDAALHRGFPERARGLEAAKSRGFRRCEQVALRIGQSRIVLSGWRTSETCASTAAPAEVTTYDVLGISHHPSALVGEPRAPLRRLNGVADSPTSPAGITSAHVHRLNGALADPKKRPAILLVVAGARRELGSNNFASHDHIFGT